jgi:hypothetical protein
MKVLRGGQVEVGIEVIHGTEVVEALEAAILLREVPEDVIKETQDSKEETPEDVTLKEVDSEVVEVREVKTVVIEVDSGVEE